MNKKRYQVAWGFIIVAILLIGIPLALESFGVRADKSLRYFGIRHVAGYTVVYLTALCCGIAATLQFPFKEEEGWTCSCGYDLSYTRKDSTHCPECGQQVVLEWSKYPGQLSTKTTRRLYWTLFLFFATAALVILGLFLQAAERWA